MVYRKNLLLAIAMLGIGAIVAASALHNHIVKVRAARLEHAVPPAPYFPPGSIWTQDISHAPLDPQSATIIGWLADAGGWGHGNKMQVDFEHPGVAGKRLPLRKFPFTKVQGFIPPIPTWSRPFPFPPEAAWKGRPAISAILTQDDCHLIVVDRSHGKLYEAYQANYADNALTANFVAVWDLNRVYPPSGRGDQCTSADAAGFPIAPLLFNADELATGSINHAIRFILPNPRIRAHVLCASRHARRRSARAGYRSADGRPLPPEGLV